MKKIINTEFGGERPLFAQNNIELENVTIHAGESAIKRCSNVIARKCIFEGKYPFWHCENFEVVNCTFTTGARAALWYSKGCRMINCKVDAPKMFREIRNVVIEDTDFPDGQEMLWDCSDVTLRKVKIKNCDYIFSHTSNIDIDNYEQHGNYSFQYGHNALIKNAEIYSKDAFWNTKNFIIHDSVLSGEYLGWYSEGLTLINCRISGTQPLCYCKNLKLENCIFESDADLAFEESDVEANISSAITSIKNPHNGIIKVKSVGEILIDNHSIEDSDCRIIVSD